MTEQTTSVEKMDFPENPLAIFSLVDRLIKAAKGKSLIATSIREAAHSTNYYLIVKTVQEMTRDNPAMMEMEIGKELTGEVLAYKVPENLIRQPKNPKK